MPNPTIPRLRAALPPELETIPEDAGRRGFAGTEANLASLSKAGTPPRHYGRNRAREALILLDLDRRDRNGAATITEIRCLGQGADGLSGLSSSIPLPPSAAQTPLL